MIASPSTFRAALMTGLCAPALVMGACSGGDKPIAEEITVDAPSLELTKADETALSRYFEIDMRGGDEDTTVALLNALGLGDAAGIEATRMIDGSTVTYTDWRATGEDSIFEADRLVLTGLHEVEGEPTFDRMDIVGLTATQTDTDDGSTAVATLAELVVVGPTPELAESLAELVRGDDDVDIRDNETASEISVDGSFRAMRLDTLVVDVTEDERTGRATIDQIVIGNDADEERMDLVVEGVDFDWKGDEASGEDGFLLKMDGLTAMGLDTSQDAAVDMPVLGLMGNLSRAMSPRARLPYRQIDLGQFELQMSILDLKTDGFEAESETKGAETTLRSVLSPMVLTFKDVSGTPLAPYMEALRENGLAEITLRGSQTMTLDAKTDRMVVTDARMEFDEGLRSRCDYAVQGMNAAAKALEESGATPPVLDISDESTREADLDAYFEQLNAYDAAQAEANALIKIERLTCDIQDIPDNSLVERGYKVASEITGSPVAVLKGSAKTMIALGSLTAKSEFERDMMDNVGSGLIDFIDTPGQTMTVTIAPDTPVSITSLTGEDGSQPTIKPLNLTVEVK